MWLLYDFLSLLKNDVNVPVFRIRIRKNHTYVLGLPDPHPDPFGIGTDPRIRIRTKMSRIRNTAVINPDSEPRHKI